MKRHAFCFCAALTAVAVALLTTGCNSGAAERPIALVEALDASAWDASQWISVADAPVVTGPVDDHEHGRSADGASWFVSDIENADRVVGARWMTTALGVYDLYVNGQLVGREVLKPGFTHPEKTRRSFTYDITPQLRADKGARNRLAVQVTPGWWADKIVTPWGHDGMVGRRCAFRGVLELTYADGTTRTLGTDTIHWQAAIAGPVTHAGIFDGEAYDARLALADTMLRTPIVNREFQGEILPTGGAEVYHRDDLALQPVRAYTWTAVSDTAEGRFGRVVIDRDYAQGEPITLDKGQTLVVDFGQNCAAVPEFTFQADEGTVLTCLPGELLNDSLGARQRGMDGPEGSVHRDNLRAGRTHMRLDYTFAAAADAAAPWATYRPRTTFFGYRYIALTATGRVTFRSIRSIPVSSIDRRLETGRLTTGNDLVNRLIQNTVWGMRSNYLSIPTDCPQRNERLGWTADTQVFSETGTFFADTRAFFHKWMRDMRDSQGPEGGFPGVAPTAQYGGEMCRLGWTDAGIIVPWTVWKQFADTAIISENWQSMDRFMQHVNAVRYDHQALIGENGNYQWADWLSYEPLESCGGGAFHDGQPLPEAVSYWNYLSACYWLTDAQMMADMARATGRDAAPYEQMAREAKEYLKETFLNADGTFRTPILNTMQTPALFALRCQLVEGDARQAMIQRLRQNIEDHDGCLQTGFLGTSILMQTLTDCGLADVAYSLLLQRRNPSWLYSVDQGATTVWERWNSYMQDRGMGPQGMNSFNHYAYGCVCQWLWETAAGINADPADPGFRHILLRPVPDPRLGHLDAEFRSPAGLIRSAWRYDGDRCTWQFTVPDGTTATVTLPDGSEPRDYQPGSYTLELK